MKRLPLENLLITGFLLLFPILLSAQSYSIKRLGLEQGLSNNFVVSITQDQRGYMWFATESGLNRFDGKEFRVYKKYFRNHSGINGNELNKVWADNTDNVVWIACQRAGLNRFDCETDSFSLFAHDPENNKSLISNAVTDVINDAQGNLWVSTFSDGIDYYDKKKNEFIHYNCTTLPALKGNSVWCIADDKKGKLYIGHVSDGLSILSIADRSIKNFVHEEGNPHSLPDNDIHCIFIDNLENIWLGTTNGLALFNPETEQFTCFYHDKENPNSLVSNTVFSITQTQDNKLWIGTETGGVSILDIRKEMFFSSGNISFHNLYQSDDETGLSYSTVRAIYEDKFNNIWIGTYSGGINFINKTPDVFHKWQYLSSTHPNGLTVKTAWGICSDDENRIWAGTDGGGICVFEGDKRTAVYTKENGKLQNNAILAALKDSEGNLWFGTFQGGIRIYKSKEKKFIPFRPEGFEAKIVRCFFEDKDKNIWIGVDDKGLYSYNLQTRILKHYIAGKQALPQDNLIRAIARDDRNRLWVGSFGGGLNVMDTAFQAICTFNTTKGFYSNTVNCLFQDSWKRMWVGTGEGLVMFADSDSLSNFTVYSEKDGMNDSYVRAITEDKNGNIWFSTNDGISKWAIRENKFYNYVSSDGVPTGQFKSGSVANSKNGYLYFGSQNGICYFNPEQIAGKSDLPPVTITGFRYYIGLTAPEGEERNHPVSSPSIQLNHNQNTFTITFNVMDYAFANQVKYAYQLKGISDEWYNLGSTNEVTFRNLPSGNYLFSVVTKMNNQDWSNKSASFFVKIKPPLWFTWWAELFYALIVVCIIFYIVRFYKKRITLENLLYLEKQNNIQQQALNNDKLQFFTNITHELRTPLTLIIGPLEDLSNDVSLPEKAGKKIRLIHLNATRLLNLINKILDFRKTETNNMPLRVVKGNLAQLVKEIGLKYAELNRTDNLLFSVSIETEHSTLYFDPEYIHIVLDNLISNAFKYTSRGEISVCMRDVCENDILFTEIEVADTGCGIPEKELDKIFNRYYQVKGEMQVSGTGIGLSLIKNLLTVHQGSISVESKEGKGASFKFRLMTHHTYPGVFHEKTDEEIPVQEEQPDEMEIRNGKRILLVVEDNPDIRHYIHDTFEEDYLVLTAENGRDGMEQAIKNVPDIIISDIMMPEMSGLELCSMLKKEITTCHIPVILLTAKTSLQDKTEGYSSGADSYITKPFSAGLLKSRVSNLLESRRTLATQIIHSKMYKQTQLTDSINRLDNEFLEKLTSIIKENSSSEKLDIEFIAQKVCMSHSTLYRKIKALLGLSVNEFIRKIKMKQAEELLLTGKYTISEIAFRVGMNSLTYFRQCFKEEFGTSPSEYVKKIAINH
ncbi:MAG: response regulator [Dysgonamonadaceae bacterium]|jgi:ligand-binding sensor domain-containing protein/signal transduction histidine kinase/DNA-binding response OmpR family regulator|nr:response regulator [Dysgonamonadaceae bacterium]